MELETALKTYLLAYAGLTALIADRLEPEELPQGFALPAVTYIKISDVKDHTLTGQLAVESPYFQFTVFASTKAGARAVANQLKAALNDYSGTLSTIVIQHIRLENEMSSLEKSPDGTVKVFTEDLEYNITFEKE